MKKLLFLSLLCITAATQAAHGTTPKRLSFSERMKKRRAELKSLAPLLSLQASLDKEEKAKKAKEEKMLMEKLNELEYLAKTYNLPADHPAHHARETIKGKKDFNLKDAEGGTIIHTPFSYVSDLLSNLWNDIINLRKRKVTFHENLVTESKHDKWTQEDKTPMYGGNKGDLYLKGKRAPIWDEDEKELFKEMGLK